MKGRGKLLTMVLVLVAATQLRCAAHTNKVPVAVTVDTTASIVGYDPNTNTTVPLSPTFGITMEVTSPYILSGSGRALPTGNVFLQASANVASYNISVPDWIVLWHTDEVHWENGLTSFGILNQGNKDVNDDFTTTTISGLTGAVNLQLGCTVGGSNHTTGQKGTGTITPWGFGDFAGTYTQTIPITLSAQ